MPSEYRAAKHDLRDPRDTRRIRKTKNGRRGMYRPARGSGAAHAFAWKQTAQVGRVRLIEGGEPLRTPQGRLIVDPLDPSTPLFSPEEGGVRVRMRGVRRVGGRARVGDWSYTEAFSLDNTSPPTAEILSVAFDATAQVVELDWRASSDDSEDRNGNGVLDVGSLEDVDGDGVLHRAPVGVAFDFHRLAPGESAPLDAEGLAALTWAPCTISDSVGDADAGLPTAPGGVGLDYTFGWDVSNDLFGVGGRFLVRATPYSESGRLGVTDYWPDEVVLDLDQ